MATTKPVPPGTLVLTRTFAAPRERVFQAWTDPKILKQWWGAGPGFTATVVEVDLRVGGRYRLGMRPPGGDADYVAVGVYREVQRPARLVYTWAWEGGDGEETLVTVEFRDQGAGTEVVLTHEGFAEAAVRDRHADGWNGCFERFAGAINT